MLFNTREGPLATSLLPAPPPPLQLFLMSKAGSHGINLVSCRRVAVLEEPLNPVYNAQVWQHRAACLGRPLFLYGWQRRMSLHDQRAG